MPLEGRTRYYPAVGPAIPRRWTGSSRVTHPFATGYCYPVRLACVKHAASVRPEPGSNSPREFDKSSVRTTDRVDSIVRNRIEKCFPNQNVLVELVSQGPHPSRSVFHHLSKSRSRYFREPIKVAGSSSRVKSIRTLTLLRLPKYSGGGAILAPLRGLFKPCMTLGPSDRRPFPTTPRKAPRWLVSRISVPLARAPTPPPAPP
jgi:hypothetical protein